MTMTVQNRQPAGVPAGGQFAAAARSEAADVDLTGPDQELACDECGTGMVIDDTGVSGHVDPDGNRDYDIDAHHVAYTTDPFAGAAPDRTPLEEEFDDLLDEVTYQQDLAREQHLDSVEAATTAASYGTAADRRQYNALHDSAKDALEGADRRRKAVTVAADPNRHRPPSDEFETPASLTALRRTVKDVKAGKVRGIVLSNDATAKLDDRLDVAGPADGTPVFVDVQSGFSPLRVTGGFVVISARSSMGNSIEVSKDATVVVLASPGRKVSTTVVGGVACVVGADEARGPQFNRGGVLDVVAKTDAMTVRTLS